MNNTYTSSPMRSWYVKHFHRAIAVALFLIAAHNISSAQTGIAIDTNFLTGSSFDDDVLDTALQSDGKLIAVGLFSNAVGVGSRHIVRLDPNGTVDTTFDAGTGANQPIETVRLQSDGKIVVGGRFTVFDGLAVGRIVRLNPDGSMDRSFDAGDGANNIVEGLAVQSDGKILAAGQFTAFGGTTARHIVRLQANGLVDTTFVASASLSTGGFGTSLGIQLDGKILLGGAFSYPGGSNVARLNSDGSLDGTFVASVNSQVLAIRETALGILIGGEFSTVNMTTRRGIARLTHSGAVDTSFVPNLPGTFGTVPSFSPQADRKILVARSYSGNQILHRLNEDGSRDTTFNAENPTGSLQSVIAMPDGSVLIAGWFRFFTQTGGAQPAGVRRLNSDGNLDPGYLTSHGATEGFGVEQFAFQPDGKILARGGFSAIGNLPIDRFARLHSDGSIDPSFNPAVDTFSAMATQPDGKIIVGGYRFGIAGTHPVQRLNNDGTLDSSFTAVETFTEGEVLANVSQIAFQPDGKIIVIGGFQSVNGIPCKGIVRLFPNGGVDTSLNLNLNLNSAVIYRIAFASNGGFAFAGFFNNFTTGVVKFSPQETVEWFVNPQPSGQSAPRIQDLQFERDGGVLIAGNFQQINNIQVRQLARVKPNGQIDQDFAIPPLVGTFGDPGTVHAVIPLRNGKVLIGGAFVSVSGRPQSGLALLNKGGSLDPSFEFAITGGSLGASVSSFFKQPDGKYIASGGFTSFGGIIRFCSSRFSITTDQAPFDYDADGRTDFSVFRPSNGGWYLQKSTEGFFGMQWGVGTDKITPADFDGDGKTDIAVYRPSDGYWYIANSSNGTYSFYGFGLAEDVPVPADYDGDGSADLCVFRPSDGVWYIQFASGGFLARQFGANGDKPTVGDFDGDGASDLAVFRPSNGGWYQLHSSDGSVHGEQFGFGSDKLAYADYDGDAKTDLAVFRQSDGVFYIKYSATSTYVALVFGVSTDIPTPGDYDGDGRADLSVFRPSDGNWYHQNSSNGAFNAFQFGANGDRPTPTAYH